MIHPSGSAAGQRTGLLDAPRAPRERPDTPAGPSEPARSSRCGCGRAVSTGWELPGLAVVGEGNRPSCIHPARAEVGVEPLQLVADAAENLYPARMQMALSLGWHIIFSCFGIAFPVFTVFAEWRGHKRGNQ